MLWVHGQRYKSEHARAFLFCMYISNFLPQMLLLWWNFGGQVWKAVAVAMLSIPAVLLGAAIGLRLGKLLGDRWLKPVSYGCLLVLALYSLLAPWVKSWLMV